MNTGRSRLVRLRRNEIDVLLRTIPALQITWAKHSRVARAALANPQSKTLRAVQANLARKPDEFHHSLAWSAIAAFAGNDELEEIQGGPATEDAAKVVAEGAGSALGEDLGALVVHVVAESDLPLAALFQGREDEFVARAARSATKPASAGTSIEMPAGETDGSEKLVADSEATDRTDDDPSSVTHVEIVDALLSEGPAIASGLRTLANNIDEGAVPSLDHVHFLAEAEAWTARARKVTQNGQSLHDAAQALRAEAEKRAGRLAELEELLETVEELLASGREKFAMILLREHDFDAIPDLIKEIEAHRVAISLSCPAGETMDVGKSEKPSGSTADERPLSDMSTSADDAALEDAAKQISDPGKEVSDSLAQGNKAIVEPNAAQVGQPVTGSDLDPAPASKPTLAVETLAPEGRVIDGPVAALEDKCSCDIGREPIELQDESTGDGASGPLASAADLAPSENHADTDRFSLGSADPGPIDQVAAAPVETENETENRFNSAGPVDKMLSDEQIAGLIIDGREALAVIAGRASGAGEARVRSLQLFAGAFGTRADLLITQEPDILLADSDESDRKVDDNRLLFASHARLALELGFAPVGSLERFRQAAALEGHITADVAAEIGHLVERGFKRPSEVIELTALPDDWSRFAESVETAFRSLQGVSITYQRASKIARHLTRSNQVLGAALSKCIELARVHASGGHSTETDWTEIESAASTLRDSSQRNRLLAQADQAVSSSQQLRKPIVASARDRLFSLLDEVETLLEEGLTLRLRAEGSAAREDPQGMADLVAVAQRAVDTDVRTIGDAAMQRLIEWLSADNVEAQSPTSLTQLFSDALLPLFELPRDEEGNVTRLTPTSEELRSLINGRDPLDVFKGYLACGNLRAAEQVISRFALRENPTVEDRLAQATQQLAKQNFELIAEVEQTLDRLQSLYDDDLVRQLSQELTELKLPADGRYDLRFSPLTSIRDQGEARLEELREQLRERARALPRAEDSQRILKLLSSRDEQLAFDYLNLAEAGEPLPVLLPPSGDDFGEFFPDIVRAAESANRHRAMDVIADLRSQLGTQGAPTSRILAQGLKAWNGLVVARPADKMTEARLAHVLRMIGLVPKDENWRKELTKAKYSGYATYAVKASPLDRSYVPSLGTQAHGSYDVTIVWDEASPQRLLQYVDSSRRTQANVILYLKTMSVAQRLELRKLTARTGFDFSPIVIDVPVIAWLSARDEPGWRLTQRVTLPFTTLNPYTPFAGGEVPEEVFVGRESEQREIMDPTGSMFVYGGRQLGKSALLRRVERGIMRVHDGKSTDFEHGQVAVYLDLKSEGIGESAAPSALWGALGRRLVKSRVLSPGTIEWNADTITAGITDWLEADEARRLLLLLDEADNFLTLDAKDTGQDGMGGFPVLQRLKGLMERSGRRFKPVFAGLHQVQRFHGLPNTPVVHGGQDIPIGPLSAIDARELVYDPLYALGYEFETPDTMWRLLRLTNYQASLIQIISEALVRHMRSSVFPSDGGRVIIKARDVDDVYAESEVRDLIAQRFRWTINLDSRYKVIALVTAVRSLESAPGERFRASELHDDCEYFWPAGFTRSTLSSAEFLRYLNEMQGLGVLYRQGEDFGLRSPSILGLLGSKETIEAELLEAGEQLDVGYQYNPTMNRRVLEQDAAGGETRSPLPDSELASLLDHSKDEAKVKVVGGTQALGLRLVSKALLRAAAERPVRAVEVDAYTLNDQIGGASNAGTDNAHVLLDLSTADMHARKSALSALSSTTDVFATVVLTAEHLTEVEAFGWPVVSLHRWSLEALQSWHESPFRRQDLKQSTGGWPELVEQAISLVMKGSSIESALSAIDSAFHDSSRAHEFVTAAEVPLEITRTWLDWFANTDSDGVLSISPASLDDLAAAFGGNEADSRSIVERLLKLDLIDESPEGWIIDRVVALATQQLTV